MMGRGLGRATSLPYTTNARTACALGKGFPTARRLRAPTVVASRLINNNNIRDLASLPSMHGPSSPETTGAGTPVRGVIHGRALSSGGARAEGRGRGGVH